MDITIDSNPNCEEVGHVVFNELDKAMPISGIVTSSANGDVECDIVGVNARGQFVSAYAQKINDSGDGIAYLIFGAEWGIRLKPKKNKEEVWSMSSSVQWGEAYKVYGSDEDIFYTNPS